jgi:enhanced entry protein EnhC
LATAYPDRIASAKRGNNAQFQLSKLYYEGINGLAEPEKAKKLLLEAQKNGYKKASKALQLLEAQTQQQASYIESFVIKQHTKITSQPAELMYLEAMNEWNRGDKDLSSSILSEILQSFPNYAPALKGIIPLTLMTYRN